MIRLTADKKKYVVRHFWEDITLNELIEAGKIPIPENVRDFYLGKIKLKITNPELIGYYTDLIVCFSDIPKSILQNTEPDVIYNFVDIYLSHIVYSLVYNTPCNYVNGQYELYTPSGIKSFKIGKEKFYFPGTRTILGQPVLMADEQIITFVEACDLDLSINTISSDKLINLPLMMAIYCRRFKEVYDQDSILSRVEKFKSLTMNKVWSLFFCIGIPLQRFQNSSRLSLKKIIQMNLRTLMGLVGGQLFTKLLKTGLTGKLQMSRN